MQAHHLGEARVQVPDASASLISCGGPGGGLVGSWEKNSMLASLTMRVPSGWRETINLIFSPSVLRAGLLAVRGFFAASESTGRTRNFVAPEVNGPVNGVRPARCTRRPAIESEPR